MKFEYISISFHGRLINGYRMSKDWNNINDAIKELTEMSKNIAVQKDKYANE